MNVLHLRITTIVACVAVASSIVSAAPRIPKVLAHAAQSLHVVAFPVLLPTIFDGNDLDHGRLWAPVVAGRHRYIVLVNLAPDCNGANVCSAGSFEAYDADYRRSHTDLVESVSPRKPDADDRLRIRNHELILDMRVRLAGGLTGLYTETPSGASDGGNSYLRWNSRGIEYAITTRISSRARLQQIADSAIQNGPLF
jgi:hypothetical protein